MALSIIDAREISPWQRHTTIMESFDNLAQGEAFLLIADHDPIPLFRQFESSRANQFGWNYVEKGPEAWKIEISRTTSAKPQTDGNCCGHCGG